MPPTTPQYFQQPTTPAISKPKPKHPPVPALPRKPLLRLEIRDLSSKGSLAFLSLPSSGSVLQNAVEATLAWLYTPCSIIPQTRSITLILRDMPGVAYTTGSDIDSDHKEIHFSTSYIEGQMHKDGFEKEVMGVITHEMVHCWQWNARGSCPGGLIEGIADFVRLRAGFVPPHWKKEAGGDWDAGYQHTGYFLDYLERRFGDGTVVKINETLRDRVYKEKTFWEECIGCAVDELWEEYGRHLKKEKEKEEDGQVSEESFEIVDAVDDNNDEEDDESTDPETQRQLLMLEQQSISLLQEARISHFVRDRAYDPRSEGNAQLTTRVPLEHQDQSLLMEQQDRDRMMAAYREGQSQGTGGGELSPYQVERSKERMTEIPPPTPDDLQNEKHKRGVDVTAEENDRVDATNSARHQKQEWQDYETQTVLQERTRLERVRQEAEQGEGPVLVGQASSRLLEMGNERRKKKVEEEGEDVVDATNPFL